MQFEYVDKSGKLGTIEANTPQEAQQKIAGLGNPNSGVRAVGGAPTIPPTATGTPSPYQLPTTNNPLIDFKNTLSAVTDLAKRQRNESSLGMMGQFQGTLAASDFNSILGNLNQATDTTAEDFIENAIPQEEDTDIYTTTNDAGTVTGINKRTGEVVWTQKGVGNAQQSGGSGSDSKSVTALRNTLNDSKFAGEQGDGKYADPDLYYANYMHWKQTHNGDVSEFLRLFPPSQYVNPDNTYLPDEIMRFTKKDDDSLDWLE